jgi:hypothetical protein
LLDQILVGGLASALQALQVVGCSPDFFSESRELLAASLVVTVTLRKSRLQAS